jgi:hypothetical protein
VRRSSFKLKGRVDLTQAMVLDFAEPSVSQTRRSFRFVHIAAAWRRRRMPDHATQGKAAMLLMSPKRREANAETFELRENASALATKR